MLLSSIDAAETAAAAPALEEGRRIYLRVALFVCCCCRLRDQDQDQVNHLMSQSRPTRWLHTAPITLIPHRFMDHGQMLPAAHRLDKPRASPCLMHLSKIIQVSDVRPFLVTCDAPRGGVAESRLSFDGRRTVAAWARRFCHVKPLGCVADLKGGMTIPDPVNHFAISNTHLRITN